jgi:tol-pal system protein YbgF
VTGRRLLGTIAVVVALAGCAGAAGKPAGPEVVATPPPAPPPTVTAPAPEPPRQADPLARIASELADLQNAVAKLMLSARQHDDQLSYMQRRLAEMESQARNRVAVPMPGFAPAVPPAALPPPPVAPPPTALPAAPIGPPPVALPPTTSPSAAVRPDPAPAPARPAVAESPAEQLFEAGLAKYEAGDLDGAVVTLYEVVASFPGEPARERAQFLIGDIFYAQKDYRGAVAELESLVKAVPSGTRAPDALLKLGMAQRALGEEAKARRTWQRLLKEHSNSEAARQARTLLRASKG